MALVALKILIAVLENLSGRVDEHLPWILGLCQSELSSFPSPKQERHYQSMLL